LYRGLVAGTIDFTRERPCPCGGGTYKVEEFDHDWGQSDEHWTMQCTECRQRYVAFQYAYTEKGRHWRAYVWVLRSNADELSRLDAVLNDTEAEILERAAGSYFDQWMALCDSSAPKKRLWEILTDDGTAPYPSLTTFYKHAKSLGVERYWRGEFSVRNLPRIIKALDIRDARLSVQLAHAVEMRTQRQAFESGLIAAGFS
jgi:hypothetical protein